MVVVVVVFHGHVGDEVDDLGDAARGDGEVRYEGGPVDVVQRERRPCARGEEGEVEARGRGDVVNVEDGGKGEDGGD
jgi:hypothetical protein